MHQLLLATALIIGGSRENQADLPAPAADVTLPRPSGGDYLPYYLPNSLPRPGTREVWQYYGVDARGRWVARVIQSPTGAYYYYNGAPFPYTTTQPHLYMPYVVD